MSFNTFAEKFFKDEQLKMMLPILKKENWDKATPTKKFEFMYEINRIAHETNKNISNIFAWTDMKKFTMHQSIMFDEKATLIDRDLFVKKVNPYQVLFSYFFELSLEINFCLSEKKNADLNPKVLPFVINDSVSLLGTWYNYIDRENEEFLNQPLTYAAHNNAQDLLLKVLKYMNNNYGMDDYIGSECSNIMLESFKKDVFKKKLNDNYKKMLENYEKMPEEADVLDKIMDLIIEEDDFSKLSDDLLYYMLNDIVIFNVDEEFRLMIYKEALRRIMKGKENLEEDLDKIKLYRSDMGFMIETKYGASLCTIDTEFSTLLQYAFAEKIRDNLLDEIEDENYRKEIQDCYKYMLTLKDENGIIQFKYSTEALASNECAKILSNYYSNKIKEAISKNKIYNKGEPCFIAANLSTDDTFLQFAFDKSYEEVKKLQFEELKENYKKKVGV